MHNSDDTTQIKITTLGMAALMGFAALLVAGVIALLLHIFAGPTQVTFKAYMDGTDVVKISGSRLWIEHVDFQRPARLTVNGERWNPAWNGDTSTPIKLRRAFKPDSPLNIKLDKELGRGDVSIVDKPSSDNNQTLAIKVDYGAFGGADWYEFTVSC